MSPVEGAAEGGNAPGQSGVAVPVAENVEPINEAESVNAHNVIKSENEKKVLRDRIKKWAKKLGVKINVLESYDEVTDEQAKVAILEQRVPGWFAGGEVYVYMPHLINEVDLDRTVVHESVAHKGIKQMLGEEFNKFLDNVWNAMSVPAKAKFLSYVGAGKNATQADRRAAADEYVAALAEKVYKKQGLTAEEKTIWQKFVAWFKKKFNADEAKAEVLAKDVLDEKDIAKMVLASYSKLTESGEVKGENDGDFRARKNNEGTRFSKEELGDIEELNDRFNRELQQQIDGTLPKTHMYQLGMPSSKLLAAEIDNLPIELPAWNLLVKSKKDYKSQHPYNLSDVKDLVRSVHNPIAVFDSEEQNGKKVILTELKDKKDRNFIAVLDIRRRGGRNYVEINSVISLYPKDSAIWIAKWFDSEKAGLTAKGEAPLLKWADKNKTLIWLSSHSSDVNAAGLSYKRIANIVSKFEKTNTESEKSASDGIKFRKAQALENFKLTQDNDADFAYALMQSIAGQEYSARNDYKRVGDMEIRVKEHTPNWDRFEDPETGEARAKKILNVTVGDYNNTDYRRYKGEYEEFVENHPETVAVDVEIEDGAYLGDALEKIHKALQEKGIDFEFTSDDAWVEQYSEENNDLSNRTYFRKVTPEMDAEYMSAVENGDMETAERLVKEAAKMAMPDTKIVDEDGYPMVVYHGSANEFTVFGKDITQKRAHTQDNSYFFSKDKAVSEDYGDVLYAAYLNLQNPLVVDFGGRTWRNTRETISVYYARNNEVLKSGFATEQEAAAWREQYLKDDNTYSSDADYVKVGPTIEQAGPSTDEYVAKAQAEGYDGLIIENVVDAAGGRWVLDENNRYVIRKTAGADVATTDYVAFSPNQIKSADAVTYDDNGNVIPLGERIDDGKEDIRFRKVFHGSGAKFDRFDHSFMGSGEGAQAFGWGTYVSEVEGIGRRYAEEIGDWEYVGKKKGGVVIF